MTRSDDACRAPLLRWLALGCGAAVFILHIITLQLGTITPKWWEIDWQDAPKHAAMLAGFALLYRLSYILPPPGPRSRRRLTLAQRLNIPWAGAATILLCSGWGALCEIQQIRHPHRDFALPELAINVLMPVVVAAAAALFTHRSGLR